MGPDVERWLLAGPPFGPAMWSAVVARWKDRVVETPDLLAHGATVDELVQALTERITRADRKVVLIGHGLALPVAWRVARSARVHGLVVTNGPLGGLDLATRAIGGIVRVVPVVARPSIAVRALASSLALRRLVVNPYVMDRDMVVALLAGSLDTPARRARLRVFLRSVGSSFSERPDFEGPTLGVWGDADPLYPSAVADEARRWFPRFEHVAVPGGRYFHPVERPWTLADEVDAWLGRGLTTT